MKHAKPRKRMSVRRAKAHSLSQSRHVEAIEIHENDLQSLVSYSAILTVSALTVVSCVISMFVGVQIESHRAILAGVASWMFAGTLPALIVLVSQASNKFNVIENLSLSIDNFDRLRALTPITIIAVIMIVAVVAGLSWIDYGFATLLPVTE